MSIVVFSNPSLFCQGVFPLKAKILSPNLSEWLGLYLPNTASSKGLTTEHWQSQGGEHPNLPITQNHQERTPHPRNVLLSAPRPVRSILFNNWYFFHSRKELPPCLPKHFQSPSNSLPQPPSPMEFSHATTPNVSFSKFFLLNWLCALVLTSIDSQQTILVLGSQVFLPYKRKVTWTALTCF